MSIHFKHIITIRVVYLPIEFDKYKLLLKTYDLFIFWLCTIDIMFL